ncbi:MAG: hypothetical protein ACXADU_03690 [Promethearchaeota archaeon]|jgi:hypothetical protein
MGKKISTKPFNITIGSKPIVIDERFSLIRGKFTRKLLGPYVNSTFPELLKKIDSVSLQKLIASQVSRIDKFKNLEKSTELLKILNSHKKSMTSNIKIITRYTNVMKTLISLFKYNVLLKKKEDLGKELIISEEYQKSNDITARIDLLTKLNESLEKNRKKLEYLAEDFFQQQNQIDQITDNIRKYELKIQNLTTQKKKFFSYINKITREMSGTSERKELKWDESIEIDPNLTNSQKIKIFQNRAKDTQSEINKITSQISKLKLKFQELNPRYEVYKQDYQKLQDIVDLDKGKIEELQKLLKVELRETETEKDEFNAEFELNIIRTKQEIQDELNRVNYELTEISPPLSIFNLENPQDISQILKLLKDINETLNAEMRKAKSPTNEAEINNIFESFNNSETWMENIETLTNIFITEINLQAFFRIALGNNERDLFMDITFLRNNKEDIRYDQLTTPEKIFFSIAFYLALEIHTNGKYIVFSNLSLPSNYNKAGSIFRTLRKILPLFESDDRLSKYNIVFIFSSLEMKKEVNNLKIITIQNEERKS